MSSAKGLLSNSTLDRLRVKAGAGLVHGRTPTAILTCLAALALSACPADPETATSPDAPLDVRGGRYDPKANYLADVAPEATYLAGSLEVAAVSADPGADARLSLVVYELSTGALCVDLVLEDSSQALLDRTGLCSDPPIRDAFDFTDGDLVGSGRTFGVAIGFAPGPVVELGGRRFNANQRGHLVRALLSRPLPVLGGLVAWAVPVEGWMPSGGDLIKVEGFSADGSKVVDQDVCACS